METIDGEELREGDLFHEYDAWLDEYVPHVALAVDEAGEWAYFEDDDGCARLRVGEVWAERPMTWAEVRAQADRMDDDMVVALDECDCARWMTSLDTSVAFLVETAYELGGRR